MTCRNCKWLEVPLDKSGRRVARNNKAYACTVEIPEPIVPASVTQLHGWKWPPSKTWMCADWGEGCSMFESRKPAIRDSIIKIETREKSKRLIERFKIQLRLNIAEGDYNFTKIFAEVEYEGETYADISDKGIDDITEMGALALEMVLDGDENEVSYTATEISQSQEIAKLKRQVEVAKYALRQLDRGEFESLLSASKIGREALKQMENTK